MKHAFCYCILLLCFENCLYTWISRFWRKISPFPRLYIPGFTTSPTDKPLITYLDLYFVALTTSLEEFKLILCSYSTSRRKKQQMYIKKLSAVDFQNISSSSLNPHILFVSSNCCSTSDVVILSQSDCFFNLSNLFWQDVCFSLEQRCFDFIYKLIVLFVFVRPNEMFNFFWILQVTALTLTGMYEHQYKKFSSAWLVQEQVTIVLFTTSKYFILTRNMCLFCGF